MMPWLRCAYDFPAGMRVWPFCGQTLSPLTLNLSASACHSTYTPHDSCACDQHLIVYIGVLVKLVIALDGRVPLEP